MRRLAVILLLLLPLAAQAGSRLADESSLYLRQHADQPVDWYPWGEDAFAKARATGKPIFVSVGYAACHWCHVMAEESFENETIAAQLNTGFISIKIDRERRPDLDEQFSLVTTMLTGSAGWPNSVFLTPEGDPFFAGGYFPPDSFAEVLSAVSDAWQNDQHAVRDEAARVAQTLRSYLDQAATLHQVTSAEITAAARSAIADLDEFNGGFGTGLKFPREIFLLFLLDQASRHGDTDLLGAVTLTLDGILRGGIHDHVGGGFHRYAVDPEWLIPHFEKMLYNQALMGRVLLRAYALTGTLDYERAATRTFDYVLRDMRAPSGAFYSAQDADSVLPSGAREEGRFYVWTPEEIDAALGGNAPGIKAVFQIEKQGLFEGRNIPSLSQSPLETAALLDLAPEKFDALLETLRQHREPRPAPIRDEKIILSWNAEMIATLAEAATVLDRPDYLQAAERAMSFLLSEFLHGGSLKRIHYAGHTDVPAQLTDYAALGTSLLALHDHGSAGTDWLGIAETLAGQMRTAFSDPGKPMRMTATAEGLGPFRPVDDTELASGNALALSFIAGLDRRQARTGAFAPTLAAMLAGDALELPAQRSGILTALEQHRLGPSGPLRVSSGGAASVFVHADRVAGRVTFDISLRDGWHLNAHAPLEDYLIGVDLSVENLPLAATAYPEPVIRRLGFSETPLALYEGRFSLTAPFSGEGDIPRRAALTLQACNDAQCLPPDEMVFWFW